MLRTLGARLFWFSLRALLDLNARVYGRGSSLELTRDLGGYYRA